MRELLEALAGLLERQDELITRLVDLGKSQLKAMRQNDFTELEKITAEQKDLSAGLVYLEGERVEIQHRLALHLQKEGSALSLGEILEQAGGEKARLEQLAGRLAGNYSQLQDLNEINRLLIRQSLAYINRILKVVTPREQATYGPGGRLALAGGGQLAIDCSI